MKAELNIGILAETLTLLYGEASAAHVSRVYTTIARLQAEAYSQGYQQAEREKEHNVVALCGTRLGDDEIVLFQRDSGDETDYD